MFGGYLHVERTLTDSSARQPSRRERRLVGGDGLEPPTFCV
jgi:hypothetical protein